MQRIPKIIKDELDKCPFPWEIVNGKKHQRVFIAGKFVAVFAQNATKDDTAGRGGLAARASIRRAIRELSDQ